MKAAKRQFKMKGKELLLVVGFFVLVLAISLFFALRSGSLHGDKGKEFTPFDPADYTHLQVKATWNVFDHKDQSMDNYITWIFGREDSIDDPTQVLTILNKSVRSQWEGRGSKYYELILTDTAGEQLTLVLSGTHNRLCLFDARTGTSWLLTEKGTRQLLQYFDSRTLPTYSDPKSIVSATYTPTGGTTQIMEKKHYSALSKAVTRVTKQGDFYVRNSSGIPEADGVFELTFSNGTALRLQYRGRRGNTAMVGVLQPDTRGQALERYMLFTIKTEKNDPLADFLEQLG